MEHIAIMKPSWGLIPKIISGEKTIESRWYQTKRAPWDKVKKGDTVYFKNSGALVMAQATVAKVLQYEISTRSELAEIIRTYGNQICLVEQDPDKWSRVPKYGILIFLKNPTLIEKPFAIDKKGFGTPAAWLCVEDIAILSS